MLRKMMIKILKCKTKYIIFMPFIILTLYFLGIFSYLAESDYKYFKYPLDIDVCAEVEFIRKHGSPLTSPINYYNYTYIYNPKDKCIQNDIAFLRVVYIVKSAAENFVKRAAIRKTWGFEKRFSDVPIRTVFILGETGDPDIQNKINREHQINGDIVQASFKDNYYNNTIKTMMAMKWAVTYCSKSKFYLFVDDDMYVSTKNLLKFLRNPLEYPGYLETPVLSLDKNKYKSLDIYNSNNRVLKQIIDIELPEDTELYAGYTFNNSNPHRHIFSKWYIPLSEYKYSKYPAYISAGAYVLSKEALMKIYYASFFTQHFRFDDIYVSILAKKVNITPLHNSEFYFYKKKYSVHGYRYVIASHGYGIPKELKEVWNEQKMSGNA